MIEKILEGVNWSIVFVAVVIAATTVAVVHEFVRLAREKRSVEWKVIEAMSGVDDEYRRLIEEHA